MKSRAEVAALMAQIFAECQATRDAGQAEYAHQDKNALANFERVAERLGISREKVLMVYLEKHIDGIHSWVNGHRSQREDVRGRIKDLIVYGVLLWAMVEDLEPLPFTLSSWQITNFSPVPSDPIRCIHCAKSIDKHQSFTEFCPL